MAQQLNVGLWPANFPCPGRFTHIGGHPSAAGRTQDRENSPARDQRSTAEPRSQPENGKSVTVIDCNSLFEV